jgi:hypothetical protein
MNAGSGKTFRLSGIHSGETASNLVHRFIAATMQCQALSA